MVVRNLRVMDALTIEAILTSSFDPASLHNRLAECGLAGPDRPADAALYDRAHSALRRPGAFRTRLQRHLDRRHAATLERAAASSTDSLFEWCIGATPDSREDFAAMIWALACDSRPVVQRFLEALLIRLARRGFVAAPRVRPGKLS
ncbi:MAG TPA: hypothetical protein VGC54_08030 [Planctomycetota bacterium]